MDKDFQTSFIPKKPMAESRVQTRRPIGLFVFVAIVILIASLASAGGAYLYQSSLVSQINDQDASLASSQKKIDKKFISTIQLADKRLSASADLLNNHIAVSPIFIDLQNLTLETIQYTKFTYSLSTDKNKKTIAVKMSGVAKGLKPYNSIAFQSDAFAKDDHIQNPVFSNLNLDEKGNVTFDLDFSVDPDFVNYSKALDFIKQTTSGTPPTTGGTQ